MRLATCSARPSGQIAAMIDPVAQRDLVRARFLGVIVLVLRLYLSALTILVGADVDAVRERDKDVIRTTPPTQ